MMNPTLQIPSRIKKLQRNEKGFPVPWFVQWIDGKPDFRVMDPDKWVAAVKYKLCWVCGEPLGKFKAFVIGPMCAINRTSSEPPSHRECAEFSAKTCPFLSDPAKMRRETNLPKGQAVGGIGIKRNPGVILIWITDSYKVYPVKEDKKHQVAGGYLIEIGDPIEMRWYAEGRQATRAEVLNSIHTGLPILRKVAVEEGKEAVKKLDEQSKTALSLIPEI